MDSLSTSVSSTLKIPPLPSLQTLHELHFLKRPPPSHLYNKRPNSISNHKPASSSYTHNKAFTNPLHSKKPTPSPLTSSPSLVFHKTATTGYATALLDTAQSNNTLDILERDVRRFLRLTRSIGPMEDKTKSQVVKEFAEKGRFQRHLVVLVKMLVDKNKVGLLHGVLEEFVRIYDEWNGTQVVLVSTRKNMEEDQLFRIVYRGQQMIGAMKVKVRNLISGSEP